MTEPSGPWLLFALGAAFFAGLTAILIKVGVTGINTNMATLIRTAVILCLLAIIISYRHEWTAFTQLNRRNIIFLFGSGIATALSWICYHRALQLGPTTKVAPIDKLSIVFVVILAATFLQEALTWQVVAGCALISAGTLVLAL